MRNMEDQWLKNFLQLEFKKWADEKEELIKRSLEAGDLEVTMKMCEAAFITGSLAGAEVLKKKLNNEI